MSPTTDDYPEFLQLGSAAAGKKAETWGFTWTSLRVDKNTTLLEAVASASPGLDMPAAGMSPTMGTPTAANHPTLASGQWRDLAVAPRAAGETPGAHLVARSVRTSL